MPDQQFHADDDDNFEMSIAVLGDAKTGCVAIVLGPMDAADVAPTIDHIQQNQNDFKARLIEHVASTVLKMDEVRE